MDQPERHETDVERADRNWSELLQELRVAQTGVQILAGFLLTLPFQQRFAHLDRVQHVLFLLAFALAVCATGLIIAPVSSHRLLFRRHRKALLVGLADKLAKAGLIVLALCLTTVVLLIFDVVVGPALAVLAAALAMLLFIGSWLLLPAAAIRRKTSA